MDYVSWENMSFPLASSPAWSRKHSSILGYETVSVTFWTVDTDMLVWEDRQQSTRVRKLEQVMPTNMTAAGFDEPSGAFLRMGRRSER